MKDYMFNGYEELGNIALELSEFDKMDMEQNEDSKVSFSVGCGPILSIYCC